MDGVELSVGSVGNGGVPGGFNLKAAGFVQNLGLGIFKGRFQAFSEVAIYYAHDGSMGRTVYLPT